KAAHSLTARRTLLRLRDLRLHVLQRQVDVSREVELDGDRPSPLPRRGRDRPDPFDLDESLLEDFDGVVLDDLRRGALPGDSDGDGRKVDVRELADADPGRRDAAEHDGCGHQHPREDGLLDAGVGQLHRVAPVLEGAGAAPSPLRVPLTLAPSRSASPPRTTSCSPGFTPDRTSTRPSAVRSPSDSSLSRATSPSTT